MFSTAEKGTVFLIILGGLTSNRFHPWIRQSIRHVASLYLQQPTWAKNTECLRNDYWNKRKHQNIKCILKKQYRQKNSEI